MDQTNTKNDKALTDFIEMLINRLSNVEEQQNQLAATLKEMRYIEEMEDNMKEAGSILSGLRHCDPPRNVAITKHYDHVSDEEACNSQVLVSVDSCPCCLNFVIDGKFNPKYEQDIKAVYGDKTDKLLEFINKGRDAFGEYPCNSNNAPYKDYVDLFEYTHAAPLHEVSERLLLHKFPNELIAYGYGGAVINFGTVRSIMKTVDAITQYLHSAYQDDVHIYLIDDPDMEELVTTFARLDDRKIKTLWMSDDIDQEAIRHVAKMFEHDVAGLIVDWADTVMEEWRGPHGPQSDSDDEGVAPL